MRRGRVQDDILSLSFVSFCLPFIIFSLARFHYTLQKCCMFISRPCSTLTCSYLSVSLHPFLPQSVEDSSTPQIILYTTQQIYSFASPSRSTLQTPLFFLFYHFFNYILYTTTVPIVCVSLPHYAS